MNDEQLHTLRFPVGKFKFPNEFNPEIIEQWIDKIDEFPAKLDQLVNGLSEKQLDTPYRPDGWTVRQVIHHLGDSHLGSYIRFKWALTEEKPLIKTYDQDGWSSLSDAINGPVDEGLAFLKALHAKWVTLLRSLTPEQWERSFIHPEMKREVNLKQNLALYAWHCKHHYAHIKSLLIREEWK